MLLELEDCKQKKDQENEKKRQEEVIEFGESDEGDMTSIKWRTLEVHYLNRIWGEMDDELAKGANK